MNTHDKDQAKAELLPCPFCGGSVSFHQDDEECRDGCHYIECKTCGTFDLSTAADPTNTVEDLGELRARIAPLWNRRAALQSQEYTAAIGGAGQAYLDRFKNAHALPAEFRWSELWAVMCVAANTGRSDATQSQDREDVKRLEWLVENMGLVDIDEGHRGWFVLERDTTNYLVEDCKTFREAIDHARRIEGEGDD